MKHANTAEIDALLTWSGPFGGLPPLDRTEPAAIEAAYKTALAQKREEIRAIAHNPAPPTFENTIAALEDSGRALQRVESLFRMFASTKNGEEMREIQPRIAPLGPALEDEIAHDETLFARIEAVHAIRAAAGLSGEQQRLVSVIRERQLRRGAGLTPAAKARLAEINGRLAELQTQFSQNLAAEQESQTLFLENEADLEGLPKALREAAARLASEKGRPGMWAIPNNHPSVWPVLTNVVRREVREKAWHMWNMRGDNPGEFDNKPLIAEVLRLRSEKARLLGYPDFAHLAMSKRMLRTPEAVMALLEKIWARVVGPTHTQLAELQALADAEGTNIRLEPWDRYYYAEKLRQTRFGIDTEAVKPYFELEAMYKAMFWATGRLHGVSFKELPEAPVCHPDVRAFEASRSGETLGVVWFDLFSRPGKTHGSWQDQLRSPETFRGKVPGLSLVSMNLSPVRAGEPVLLNWQYATILFHEFGHAVHMLSSRARYPSLGSMGVAWDCIELPSLLNERWLGDRELLDRFALHHETGEPIPSTLVDAIENSLRSEPSLVLALENLGGAMVDMKMHMIADGEDIDVSQFEEQMLAELGLPSAMGRIVRTTASIHSFAADYAAGHYVYLWSAILAADIADAFAKAPGGFYDASVAKRWRETILGAGATTPEEIAFQNFRGRPPNPEILLAKFGLERSTV